MMRMSEKAVRVLVWLAVFTTIGISSARWAAAHGKRVRLQVPWALAGGEGYINGATDNYYTGVAASAVASVQPTDRVWREANPPHRKTAPVVSDGGGGGGGDAGEGCLPGADPWADCPEMVFG